MFNASSSKILNMSLDVSNTTPKLLKTFSKVDKRGNTAPRPG